MYLNFMKIHSVGTKLFCMDRHTCMTKLIVVFHNFENTPITKLLIDFFKFDLC